MPGGRGRFGLVRQADVRVSDEDAADHEAIRVGVVEHDLAFSEQALDQIPIAQLLVGNALHHVGMSGVIIAFEHLRIAPS